MTEIQGMEFEEKERIKEETLKQIDNLRHQMERLSRALNLSFFVGELINCRPHLKIIEDKIKKM